MEEEKQLEQLLVDEMAHITNANRVSRLYDQAETNTDYANLDELALKTLMEGRDPENDPNYAGDRIDIDKQLKGSPKDSIKTIIRSMGLRVAEMKNDYEANLDTVYNAVEIALNSYLSEAKDDKTTAVNTIAGILAEAIQTPPATEQEADALARSEFIKRTKVIPVDFTPGRGDKKQVEAHKYRMIAESYLTEVKGKDDKVTGYQIDSEKLKELMSDPVNGSTLYTLTQSEEAAKEAA